MRQSFISTTRSDIGGALFAFIAAAAQSASLNPGEPLLLEKTQGRFDFLRVDAPKRRLLLAHTGNKSLDVIDLDAKRLIKSVMTGAAQDSTVDAKRGRYYVSVSAPPRMAIVDSASLEMIGEVPLTAPADLIMYNPDNGLVYVCNDDTPELWIIDPDTRKILHTIALPGKGMEDLAFDTPNKHLLQVLKDANTVAVLDPSDNKVLESWPTAPAASPHGMSLVPESHYFLVAGGNGKLVLMDRAGGKVLSNADIASRVDQMAYDAKSHMAYCASGTGKISVVGLDQEKLTSIGDVASAAGCHSITLDPKTGALWIAYAKGDQSFAQPFTSSSEK